VGGLPLACALLLSLGVTRSVNVFARALAGSPTRLRFANLTARGLGEKQPSLGRSPRNFSYLLSW
jgi:hypothetical protein